jgi:predicted Rossmann fold nucleotide-binding protein DprA/Smf involved in DNA uptake
MTTLTINADDARYPPRLTERLGDGAPAQLSALGNPEWLTLPKTALFCSVKCPGSAILSTYDQAAKWRDSGRCVISGFHSPVEKECLDILLRGSQPIIVCPARTLPQRVPPEWRMPLTEGRMLVLSAFEATKSRKTEELATRRNEIVAALADELWFAHITPGGKMEKLALRARPWHGWPERHS